MCGQWFGKDDIDVPDQGVNREPVKFIFLPKICLWAARQLLKIKIQLWIMNYFWALFFHVFMVFFYIIVSAQKSCSMLKWESFWKNLLSTFFFFLLIRCNEFKRFFSKYLILDLNKLIRFLISIAKFDLKNSVIFFAMHKKMHLMSSEGVLLKVDFTLQEK